MHRIVNINNKCRQEKKIILFVLKHWKSNITNILHYKISLVGTYYTIYIHMLYIWVIQNVSMRHIIIVSFRSLIKNIYITIFFLPQYFGKAFFSICLCVRVIACVFVYSREFSISSCFKTLVWLVSLSSPARNISSTMLYTLKKLKTRSSSHTLWKYSFKTSTKLWMASR